MTVSQVIDMDPFRCRMWADHDRLEEYLTEESCRPEIKSFQAHGQHLPVLGRELKGDPSHDVELIFGARRLFVARTLNVPLRVELRDIADRDAFITMDIENRHRKDISPYERGLSYKRLLEGKYFQSQEDIAHALGISPSQVSRLLKLARLPAVLLSAFKSPLEVKEGWGLDLYDSWQHPERRKLLSEKARSIASKSPRLNAVQVYEKLLSEPMSLQRTTARVRDQVITGRTGKPIFRIRYRRRDVMLILPAPSLSKGSLEAVKAAVTEILQRESAQGPDSSGVFAKGTARTASRVSGTVQDPALIRP